MTALENATVTVRMLQRLVGKRLTPAEAKIWADHGIAELVTHPRPGHIAAPPTKALNLV